MAPEASLQDHHSRRGPSRLSSSRLGPNLDRISSAPSALLLALFSVASLPRPRRIPSRACCLPCFASNRSSPLALTKPSERLGLASRASRPSPSSSRGLPAPSPSRPIFSSGPNVSSAPVPARSNFFLLWTIYLISRETACLQQNPPCSCFNNSTTMHRIKMILTCKMLRNLCSLIIGHSHPCLKCLKCCLFKFAQMPC